ncbi:Transcription factor GRAS [Arabidopsis thaliana x Arabidopsis arenosa]|uniref:Transcription factor GRAS n=1 Tax=Arabidopsis thaliana x Arabidopsis arenosa TaxID=1240361 RepID=A0A8T2A9U8_9BRAS|nr:Transcription factor GRAS [Arabidopsis thaliana x Arabidopsis arenosa]
MITEPNLTGISGTVNRNRLSGLPDQSASHSFTPVTLYDGFNYNLSSDHRNTVVAAPPQNSVFIREVEEEEDPADDFDFSDAVLGYISQMLNEEDMDDKVCMLQESLDLETAERSLYEAIGKKYPPSPERNLAFAERNDENLDRVVPGNYTGGDCIGFGNGGIKPLSGGFTLDFRNPQSCSSVLSVPQANGLITIYGDGIDESSKKSLYPDSNRENHQSVWLFRSGIEEANRFIPEQNELIVNFREENCVNKARKNSSRDEICVEEERSSKLPAVFGEDILRSDVVDKILVHVPGEESMKEFDALREVLKKGVEKKKASVAQGGKRRARGRGRGRGGGGGQNGKKEVVDLRSLLIHCAQAVAADDRRCAGQLLKQIRLHSTPFGDGNQRLAHCFANGLEARLAGTGSQIYKGIVSKPRSAAAVLKAHQLFLACCPFRKLSYFITNKTIRDLVGNSQRVHVIDFGILYGFQWPTLIHRFSRYGSPKVRITGIEFPQPGFRPAQRVEETGQRLAAYAKQFGVAFEYKAIAKKWDAVQLEDLDIDRDEITVVNCLYRAENLHDESVKVESCRDTVLNLIGKINPDLFVFGIVNGAYNAPFFVTRFREALFHFSSIFDMLETIVPREDEERMFLEMEVFGREALNVIACEGWERVERPETYKQWHVRAMRSGLVQVPFDPNIMKTSLHKVHSFYHKDFVIDQDNRWLLQGWKGRTVMALSVWKPESKA